MKLKITDKIRYTLRKAMGKPNKILITYKRKRDGVSSTYFINGNFIEDYEDRFNTYAYSDGFKNGSIKTFIKSNVEYIRLV
jgi:hypothetical protein